MTADKMKGRKSKLTKKSALTKDSLIRKREERTHVAYQKEK